jgi:hypothetical protein
MGGLEFRVTVIPTTVDDADGDSPSGGGSAVGEPIPIGIPYLGHVEHAQLLGEFPAGLRQRPRTGGTHPAVRLDGQHVRVARERLEFLGRQASGERAEAWPLVAYTSAHALHERAG